MKCNLKKKGTKVNLFMQDVKVTSAFVVLKEKDFLQEQKGGI